MNPELEGLDDSPHWYVYREIVAILKSDAALSRAVRHWATFTEDDAEDGPHPPTGDQAPAIYLNPGLEPSRWETASSHESPLRIGFNLYVAGRTARPAWRLWWAVHRALFPPDKAEQHARHRRICAAASASGGRNSGIVRITQPAFMDVSSSVNFACVEATGEISLPLQLPS